MGFRGEQPSSHEQREDELPSVPESEIDLDFVRSSGPGGQKVNKTSSKAQLRWNVGESAAFTDAQKEDIREAAGNRLNADDEIVLAADTERSQVQNKGAVIERLQNIVANALTPQKERKETRVSRSQKVRRLDDKRRASQKKTESQATKE